MSNKPPTNAALISRLSRSSEITITVTGRTSGRRIAIPIWFVFEDPTLYLLPVYGSDTQWYKNVLEDPAIRVAGGGAETDLQAVVVADAKGVASVVEKFRGKYGPADVKKYYSKFDVAITAQIP